MTRTTPELAPPLQTSKATPTGGRLTTTYDLTCNRPHTRRIFSGIGSRTWNPSPKRDCLLVPRPSKNTEFSALCTYKELIRTCSLQYPYWSDRCLGSLFSWLGGDVTFPVVNVRKSDVSQHRKYSNNQRCKEFKINKPENSSIANRKF
ncbi:hypothetical protein AVEN_120560-1 [Araneus ventricosus]|uniref:Uncharacterized protein n=1 Tax=Araneus ventricosus TaxID=182803 RepID=A0A4Y2HDR0_ARAVE|nr:hypothetical protein AVEN_120560-1 [Araneus ventricosus]